MNYKEIFKIQNTSKYTINQNYIIFTSDNDFKQNSCKLNIFNIENFDIEKQIDTNTIYIEIFSNQKTILCKDGNNNGILIDYSLSKLNTSEPIKVTLINEMTNKIPIYRGKIYNREFGVFDIRTKGIIWMKSYLFSLQMFNDYLIDNNNLKITRVDLSKGDPLWSNDLKEIVSPCDNYGYMSIVAVFKKLLLIGLHKFDKLIAIDLETGQILWEKVAIVEGLYIDQKQGVIHQMMINYGSYDIHTGNQINTFVNNEYFKSVGIETQRSNFAMDGDHIITTDMRKGTIGAFNTKTFEFDWVYKQEGISFPGASPIIFKDHYLLVHDNKGCLHIFEKENV
jgi:outer membrane protein assembly factor BamB